MGTQGFVQGLPLHIPALIDQFRYSPISHYLGFPPSFGEPLLLIGFPRSVQMPTN